MWSRGEGGDSVADLVLHLDITGEEAEVLLAALGESTVQGDPAWNHPVVVAFRQKIGWAIQQRLEEVQKEAGLSVEGGYTAPPPSASTQAEADGGGFRRPSGDVGDE